MQLTEQQKAALAVLDRWLKSMDNPDMEPPLEIHHGDIGTLRQAVLGTGYRLVPEDALPTPHELERWALDCEGTAAQMLTVADAPVSNREAAAAEYRRRADRMRRLASTLSPKEVEPRG